MDADDKLWFVESGRVELYLRTGAGRRFLFGVKAGDVLLPVQAMAREFGFELLALGRRAKLLELPIDAVLNAPEVAAPWLDGWLSQCAGVLDAGAAPVHSASLPHGQESSLPEGESGVCDTQLGWVSVLQGHIAFAGAEQSPPANLAVPLPQPLWVTATASETNVTCVPTREMVSSDQFTHSLAYFHRHVMLQLRANEALRAHEDQRRFMASKAHEQRRLDQAVSTLAGVSATQQADTIFEGVAQNNPTLAALQLVGQALGATITPMPAARPGRQLQDPVAVICRASRLRHRPVALRGRWWTADNGPLLAYLAADDRPVALIPSRGGYTLLDPTSQRSQHVTETLALSCKPMAVSLLRSLPRRQLDAKALWAVVGEGLRGNAALIMACGVAAGLLGLALPILTGMLLDDVIPLADRDQLWVIAGLLVLFAVGVAGLELTRGLALLKMEARVEQRLEAGIMDRLLGLPSRFFRDYQAGDLAMRALGVSMARRALTGGVLAAMMAGIFSLVNLGLLFVYEIKLALIGLALALIASVVMAWRVRVMLQFNRQMVAQEGRVSGLLLQLLSGIAKLRVAAAERRAFSVWAEQFAQQKRTAYQAGAVQNHFEVFQAAYPIFASIVMFAGVFLITEQLVEVPVVVPAEAAESLTTGQFVAVITAFTQFLTGFLGMGLALLTATQAVPLFERAWPILEAIPEVGDNSDDPGALSGAIDVSHLSFSYGANGPKVLDDVSFSVQPGQMVALVGGSGSGKSTLLRLLLGLEAPDSGDLYYDGQSLSKLDVEAVRNQIGTVMQRDRVQPGDVFHNIVGQGTSLTLNDAWAAARAAGLEDDIKALPMGMNTYVNDGGSTFSGGQRQRMLIARAIVHKPRILFFDEATSALDNHTQQVVSQALASLRVTRVVIAHRLSTIESADVIHVMDRGIIVETGNYSELMAANGLFAKLAQRQLA
ncbi:NHLP bacteriocin export ABC transporter permease/ATPase subunit [bacterium]|nr:NHLP bacteriocin export ABC transporter permease/ATPase subunit [bacterium]